MELEEPDELIAARARAGDERAHRSLGRYEERQRFRVWLLRILANRCRSIARKRAWRLQRLHWLRALTPAREHAHTRTGDWGALSVRMMIAPGAHTVELAGDFSSWQAIRLQRESTDAFGLLLKLDPGIYHLSVRINGGAWQAPPGLPAIADEFGSKVGVFQVRLPRR